jgi:hypothetical protein
MNKKDNTLFPADRGIQNEARISRIGRRVSIRASTTRNVDKAKPFNGTGIVTLAVGPNTFIF